MYTMILVDDEPIIQMGLRSILNYREYDIEITGVATDGEEALELIRHTSPDLVMMDINIPVINGLEVMEKANAELDPPPLFIILSCHDEFRYAKKAVRLGALDYLLKVELTPDMLKETLQKAIRQLCLRCPDPEMGSRHFGEHASLTDSFFLKLLNNWFDTPQSLSEMASDLSIPLQGGCYVCICFGWPSAAESISVEADRPVSFSGSSDALIRLCSLITGLCRQFGQCYATPWDFNSIAMILALPDTPSRNTDPYEAVFLPVSPIFAIWFFAIKIFPFMPESARWRILSIRSPCPSTRARPHSAAAAKTAPSLRFPAYPPGRSIPFISGLYGKI